MYDYGNRDVGYGERRKDDQEILDLIKKLEEHEIYVEEIEK